MTTVGNGAQGFAITAHNSALVGGSGYFGQSEPSGGTAIVNEPMRRVLTLLAQIAQTNEENERKLLFERLYEMQGEDDALIEQIGLNVAQLPEGISMVNESIRETLALLVRIAGTDKEDEKQSLLWQLYDVQEKNNTLVEQIGLKVETLLGGGFGVITNQDGKTYDISTLLGDISNLIAISEFVGNNAAVQAAMTLAAETLVPFLSTYGLPIALAVLAAGGIYWATKDAPDWFDDGTTFSRPMSLEDEEAKGVPEYTKDRFIEFYEDTPSGRDAYLGYLAGNDPELYEQEMAIAGKGHSFSTAEKMRIEKGLEEPKSQLFESTEVQPDGDMISISSSTNVPNAPTIKRKSSMASGEELSETSLSHKIANPSTGAGEGVLDALRAGNVSPYQMDGLGTDSNGTLNAQDGFSERLAAALEKLAEVCALPRVSVGTLAETAVVREEADLDTLARRLAGELLHAQMVS